MNERLCRWGILGSAGIARKNWQAIRHSGNGRLVAVASRSREKAAAFIAEGQAQVPHDPVPEAVGGYAELLARPDIGAVYIPLPTGLRKEWVLAAAAAVLADHRGHRLQPARLHFARQEPAQPAGAPEDQDRHFSQARARGDP